MKKKFTSGLVSALVLSLGLSCLQPQNANAAIIVDLAGDGDPSIAGVLSVPLLLTSVGIVGTVDRAWIVGEVILSGLLLLDADGSISQDKLAKVFADRYPFIDNYETFSQLARTLKAKIPEGTILEKGKKYMLSLSENETREILRSEVLTEEQILKIVTDLK